MSVIFPIYCHHGGPLSNELLLRHWIFHYFLIESSVSPCISHASSVPCAPALFRIVVSRSHREKWMVSRSKMENAILSRKRRKRKFLSTGDEAKHGDVQRHRYWPPVTDISVPKNVFQRLNCFCVHFRASNIFALSF